jgi:hypothetical protein
VTHEHEPTSWLRAALLALVPRHSRRAAVQFDHHNFQKQGWRLTPARRRRIVATLRRPMISIERRSPDLTSLRLGESQRRHVLHREFNAALRGAEGRALKASRRRMLLEINNYSSPATSTRSSRGQATHGQVPELAARGWCWRRRRLR